MNCYICNKPIINENKTLEHILLNSIGGRLKSDQLICKKCNSELGEDIDTELSKQLNFIANMLNIKRERGEPQKVSAQSDSGDEIWIMPGGKPSMKKPIIKLDEKGEALNVIAPRMKGLKKQLQGLTRNYPNINLDEAFDKAEVKREYLSDKYKINQMFGGQKALRSISKTAVNFYMYHGGERDKIIHLIDYIKGESNYNKRVAAFYYPQQQQDIVPKKKDEILHSIILKGNSNNNLLYCYVELFNFYRVLVLLNDDYHGADIEEQYIYDVMRTKKKDKQKVYLSDDKYELSRVFTDTELPIDVLQQELNRLMQTIHAKQSSEHINSLLENALEKSLKQHPEGIEITHEMFDEFIDAVMKEITPWLIHRLEKNED